MGGGSNEVDGGGGGLVVDLEAGSLLGIGFALGFLGARGAGFLISLMAEGFSTSFVGFFGGLSFSRIFFTPDTSVSMSPSVLEVD